MEITTTFHAETNIHIHPQSGVVKRERTVHGYSDKCTHGYVFTGIHEHGYVLTWIHKQRTHGDKNRIHVYRLYTSVDKL
jgi:hypothetical protein